MGHLSNLKLPLLGETMETGRITEWCVKPGDYFTRGQVLLEVETDKTIVEVPALQHGKLLEVLADVGTEVVVGGTIARIELEGEAPLAASPHSSATSTPTTATDSPAIPMASSILSEAASPTNSTPSDSVQERALANTLNIESTNTFARQRQFVTPRARHTARQHGIDTTFIAGSGRRGRIVHNDIVKKIAEQSSFRFPVDRYTDLIDTPLGLLHRSHWVVRRTGSATTVVLLHGLFGDSQLWNDIAVGLTDSRAIADDESGVAVCAIDLPGHGNSHCSASKFDEVCEAIALAIDEFDSVILVGHSYGGAVATSVATQLPEKMAALVLIAPVGLGDDIDQHFLDNLANSEGNETRVAQELEKLSTGSEIPEQKFVRELGKRLEKNSQQLQSMVADIAVSGKQQKDLSPQLDALSIPVSIVWGRQDRIVNWQQSLSASAHTSLYLLSDLGHMPHLDHSEKFIHLLRLLCQTKLPAAET